MKACRDFGTWPWYRNLFGFSCSSQAKGNKGVAKIWVLLLKAEWLPECERSRFPAIRAPFMDLKTPLCVASVPKGGFCVFSWASLSP